jgi:hypothetical protein
MPIPSHPIVSILFRPAAAWDALRTANRPWSVPLLRHVAPLALLPAVAWPVGQVGSGVLPAQPGTLLGAFGATFAFSVASVLLLALALYAVSPFFRCQRRWHRCFSVAAYASTPVLVSGALLFIPMLLIACFAAFAFFFVLCDMGVKQVLGCREDEADSFVVVACVLAAIGSMALGALCSAAGLI